MTNNIIIFGTLNKLNSGEISLKDVEKELKEQYHVLPGEMAYLKESIEAAYREESPLY